jgi:hypothetical protein
MKYYLHDSNSFNDEKITELFISFGYEGLGLFYTILEKLAAQEKPIKTTVLKSQLKVGKKLQKCWDFMESIELISSNNGETFNNNLLNFSGKYKIKKEKTRERVSQWRKNQELTKNVTCYESVCNTDKVNKSKLKETKEITYNKVVDEILVSLKDLFGENYLTSDKTKVMFDKLLKKYSKDEILKATFWARNDDFWKTNFCSPLKLEKKNKEDVTYIDVFLEKAGKYKIPTTEPMPSVPYEGFNPLSIDLSKLKPLR